MLHASYFEEFKTCLSRGPMYDVIYVFIIFSHTENHVLFNWPFHMHCYFGFDGAFFSMKLLATHLNVKTETCSRSHFPNFALTL